MKRRTYLILGAAILIVGGAYYARHWAYGLWLDWNKPQLPAPTTYAQEKTAGADQLLPAAPSPVEGGLSVSENYVLESSPQTNKKEDPLAGSFDLPSKINLDVPWISQAPKSDWDMPYQEACEEASMIMIDGFYEIRGSITPDQADAAILKLVAYENKIRGDYKDTDAKETAQIIRDYFGYKDVRVLPFKTADDIKNIVGRGYPVIIPFSGKDLQNPNYRNGGPLYHMLVIKGYTDTGYFITDDPGTRKGKDYVYTLDRIVEAAHDWNGGDVANGGKFMIVVMPNA
ncbi:MAG: C39 family peptidase [Patescibacteria group bacterium]|nr:C39 family peptidase [Patescibacteria group bacterium]